mmetsp:Transcript_1346/g.2115  ORF Transcript_1346/g.2115 Transcript_1346/m.2115 type:complete len:102 (-) Transcript_1346:144-449(-)
MMSFPNDGRFCNACSSKPCVWIQHQEVVLAGVEHWKLMQDTNGLPYPPNERRKICYRQFTRAFHGVLGRGERVHLPSCVIAQVREKFPNPDDIGYMGFRGE